MPTLSVIIPIYNVEEYLEDCLRSCLVNNKNVEYLLVDDGSTDNSFDIAQTFANKFQNIKVIHKENGGLSSARNAGIKYAKGKWIYFIDSDDYVSKKLIPKLLNILNKKNIDVDLFSIPLKKVEGVESRVVQDGSNKYVSNSSFALEILKGRREISVCALVFNSTFFKDMKLHFKEGFLFEDQFFTPIVIANSNRIFEFSGKDVGYYYYRMRKGSITHSAINKEKVWSLVNAETFKNDHLATVGNDNEIKYIANNNKIDVYFRAYLNFLLIDEKDSAQSILSRLKKIKTSKKVGLKEYIKLNMIYLPKKILMNLFRKKIVNGK